MTRLTAMWIYSNVDVEALAYGPDKDTGKFGVYIGAYDESPSGFKRPRPLLTGEPRYDTAEAAKAAGEAIIREVREGIDPTND